MPMLNPVHPGEVIREDVLEELGLSVKQAAERLGVSRVALSRVLNARARYEVGTTITPPGRRTPPGCPDDVPLRRRTLRCR